MAQAQRTGGQQRWRPQPPDRGALWVSLSLTGSQVAALCGLQARQVARWTRQGYLSRSVRDPGRYSGDAVDMAVLIRQGLDQGLSLRAAVDQARAYRAAERTRQPDLNVLDPAQLVEVHRRLRQASAAVRDVQATVEPLAPPGPPGE